MCRSMVDIQSVAAEIRRGIKKEDRRRKKKETTGQKYNGPLLHRAAIIKRKCKFLHNIMSSANLLCQICKDFAEKELRRYSCSDSAK